MKHSRTLWIAVLAVMVLAGCFGKKQPAPIAGTSAEPDTVLYNRATNDIKHGKYTEGRLALQTLINTYPDSEYLAKAKLVTGDSYYKEGGSAGLKQSIVEYKDFITFFPFLDEAAYAQMQVAMAHYRQMEKPDRDHSEAVEAEAEFQTLLEKYPTSTYAAQAEQRLRETQEVLAEGNFRIARFYYIRGANKAAVARLLELTSRYPLYSQADTANWMLGQIYEKAEHNEVSARFYANIVKEYPLSPLAPEAKAKLVQFGSPVPQPDPEAVARMEAEQKASRERPNVLARSTGILKRGPDVTMASHSGAPTLTPASESGDETLSLGPGPALGVTGPNAATGSTATVETVTPGGASSSADPAPQPSTDASSATPAAASTPSGSDSTASAPSGDSSSDPNATPAAQSTAPAQSTTPAQSATPAPPANTSQESTSKKKSGIHKLFPF